MPDIYIKPSIGIIVILITIATCFDIYYGMVNLNEEAFYRGFNAGSEAQKMLDDLNNHRVDKPIPPPNKKIKI